MIQPVADFLKELGYIQHSDIQSLTNNDLGLKGILATEVNEGHPILMTEMYISGMIRGLSGDELVGVLASFQEKKDTEEQPSISDLRVSANVVNTLQAIRKMADAFQDIEHKIGYPVEGYWNTSTVMIEPMLRWMEGTHSSVICEEYNIFEGNFMRVILKIANMLDELLAMATYCQHVEEVEKITEVKARLIRDVAMSDSLYL